MKKRKTAWGFDISPTNIIYIPDTKFILLPFLFFFFLPVEDYLSIPQASFILTSVPQSYKTLPCFLWMWLLVDYWESNRWPKFAVSAQRLALFQFSTCEFILVIHLSTHLIIYIYVFLLYKPYCSTPSTIWILTATVLQHALILLINRD